MWYILFAKNSYSAPAMFITAAGFTRMLLALTAILLLWTAIFWSLMLP
ncbi:hypothetical protein [Candidatus Palibaumannia cicadellinicola]|nr:hypothetical protein [Candidatus Baumannia cicadellinicola]MCJ7462439.1 hypothetical protein [Candidatus Baumannia cicadellinicola]MCJ7463029.1 hypothetical protein [Candidatus Baumannia cicadellinicola]